MERHLLSKVGDFQRSQLLTFTAALLLKVRSTQHTIVSASVPVSKIVSYIIGSQLHDWVLPDNVCVSSLLPQ